MQKKQSAKLFKKSGSHAKVTATLILNKKFPYGNLLTPLSCHRDMFVREQHIHFGAANHIPFARQQAAGVHQR